MHKQIILVCIIQHNKKLLIRKQANPRKSPTPGRVGEMEKEGRGRQEQGFALGAAVRTPRASGHLGHDGHPAEQARQPGQPGCGCSAHKFVFLCTGSRKRRLPSRVCEAFVFRGMSGNTRQDSKRFASGSVAELDLDGQAGQPAWLRQPCSHAAGKAPGRPRQTGGRGSRQAASDATR